MGPVGKQMKENEERLVVPSVTDEDPMTSKRITRQPKKKTIESVVERLKKSSRKK